MRTVGVLAAALALSGLASAKPWWVKGVQSNEGDFLDPDMAFKAGLQVDGGVLRVRWVIADGYYLYRERMAIEAAGPELTLGPTSLPEGLEKSDPYLGTQRIFLHQVEATVPFTRLDAGAHPIEVKVTYQGCATAGLCYPPISKVLFAPTAVAMQQFLLQSRPQSLPQTQTLSQTQTRSQSPSQTLSHSPLQSQSQPLSHPWEGVAILGGGFAYLFAGFLLRKGRRLDTPAA